MRHKNVIDELDALLPDTPYARPGGSLLLMVGLPASGKSSIVEQLQKSLPFVLISTDGIRAQISYQPTYTLSEMTNIYEVSYKLIEKRLRRGQRVVFDASNYLAARRDHVIGLAQGYGAPVAVCLVQASQEMVRQRLLQRVMGNRRRGDLSDADWAVYKWMVEAQEPIVGAHLILDTTNTAAEPLARRLFTYWLTIERDAASHPDLQPPSWASKFISHD